MQFGESLDGQALLEAQRHLSMIADHLPMALLYIDHEQRLRFVNKTYQAWHALPASAFLGKTMDEVFSDKDTTGARYRDVAPYVQRALAGECVTFECQRLVAGGLRNVELSYIPNVVNQKVAGFYVMIQDITDRRNAQLYLEHSATHDPMTGLPTRKLFLERLDMALARADRHGKALAVLVFNLNNFRQFNDLHGHAAGDRLLMQFAETLRHGVRKIDTLARLGGDQFAILAEELVRGESDGILIAEKVIGALRTQNKQSGYQVTVTTSIGIAVQSARGADALAVLAQADGAMYQSKEAGGSSWTLA